MYSHVVNVQNSPVKPCVYPGERADPSVFAPPSLYRWSVGTDPRLTTHSHMRFTPEFLDELRARLPVSEVVGRRVKLK
jgi:hypothetical protein